MIKKSLLLCVLAWTFYTLNASINYSGFSLIPPCNDVDTVSITIGEDAAYCLGTTITLIPSQSADFYTWSTGEISQSIEVDTSGIFWVEINDTTNCLYGIDSIELAFETVYVEIDTFACEGTVLEYNGFNLNAGEALAYTTLLNGCWTNISVNVVEKLHYNQFLVIPYCQGDNPTFNGQSLVQGQNYTFNFISQFNCDSVINVSTQLLPDDIQVDSIFYVCPNQTININGVELSVGQTQSFTFDLPNISCDSVFNATVMALDELVVDTTFFVCEGELYNFSNSELAPNTTTPFTFISQVTNCDSVVNVTINETFVEEINDTTISVFSSESILVNWLPQYVNYNYQWQNQEDMSCTDCATPTLFPTTSKEYTVTIYNEIGCSTSAIITVNVEDIAVNWLNPNTFSPNSDGFNDTFAPQPLGITKDYQLSIYNRWGQLIFSSNNPQTKWNGLINGKEKAPMGVYVYQLVAKNGLDELIEVKGSVTLIR